MATGTLPSTIMGTDANRLVISYLRFSTPQQLLGDSKRRQMELSRRWAAERGLTISEDFHDYGISAYKGRNAAKGALARILSLIERSDIPKGSVLLVESLDRLSRDKIPEALQLFLGIINAGVEIVTLCDNRHYTKAKLDLPDLITSIAIMSRANDESAVKAMRMRENWEQFRKQAASGAVVRDWVPAWLQVRNGKIVPVAVRVKAVKRVFDLACDGYGLGAITRKLNRDGVPPIGRTAWNKTYVHLILRGRQVLGDLVLRKSVDGKPVEVLRIENYYPQVIDQKTWDRANAILSQKRQNGFRGTSGPKAKWVNLFSGLLFDDREQTWFVHQNAHGGKRLVNNSGEQLGVRERTFLRLDLFEPMFFDVLLGHFPTAFLGKDKPKDGADDIRAEVAEVDARIVEVENEMLEGGGSVKALTRVMAKLEAKRDELEARLRAAQATSVVADRDRTLKLMERFKAICDGKLDHDARAELQATLRLLVKRIGADCPLVDGDPGLIAFASGGPFQIDGGDQRLLAGKIIEERRDGERMDWLAR